MTDLHEQRKEKIIALVNEEFYVPMKCKELAQLMQVSQEDRAELEACLSELVLEGKLQKTVKGKYIKGDGTVAVGTFIGNPRGFGFVEVEGREEDLFISESHIHGAMHMDIVRVQLLPGKGGKRQEAEVTEIITRGFTTLVGTFQASANYGFVVPDNQKFGYDIFVAKERTAGAVSGHKVIVEITDYGDAAGRKNPEGKIVEILGHMDDPGVDILSIIKNYDIPTEFTEKELHQAERVSKPVSDADREGRKDLRSLKMVTIDGEDSKDLDDAVSLTVSDDGHFHLGVHIADVSNYVQENSALDREALKRGTSVYLVDRVIPMLPHTLSNGICSLNQGEDRLALSCLMDIDDKGNIVDYEITESVINVDRRMTYTAVNAIITDHDPEVMAEYEGLCEMFFQMAQLSTLLRKKRRKRGAIDFDLQECKIHLDANGRVKEILPYDRNRATRLIEDFMLAANETVAEHFYWLSVPFVYRTHEMPDPEKMKQLRLLAAGMGYPLKTGKEEIHPKELQKLLDKIEGTQAESYL
ncbi:MAG: ribonuclease R, partial [Lachnospiraceae bacterium]|nr:ribonuclease R [Lachnospiraceae bacterium]